MRCLSILIIIVNLSISFTFGKVSPNMQMIGATERKADGVSQQCMLYVNGKEVDCKCYINVDEKHMYAMIPIESLLLELGAKIDWRTETLAEVIIFDKVYYLDTERVIFTEGANTFNYLIIPPGEKHGVIADTVEGVFVVDSDSLKFLVKYLFNGYIKVYSSEVCVDI